MSKELPVVYFYIAKKDWLEEMPVTADKPWEEFGRGIYCWTLQTYLRLKEHNFPCQLVDTLPDEGIVLAHRDSLPYELRPASKVLLVCLKADREPHPYAQFHIVQNPEEAKLLSNSLYIPHWPQPGLIRREVTRGNQIKNAVYMGISYNLAPELKEAAWQGKLQQLDLSWQIRPRELWHDYSDVDVIIAVRSFLDSDPYLWKPATKLYNSWHARVPAILGRESAFRAERKGELDYLEVQSPEEVIHALTRLKNEPELYQAMVKNGKARSREVSKENISKKWQNAFEQVLYSKYEFWCNLSAWQQKSYTSKCYFKIKAWALRDRLSRFKSTKSFQQFG